MLLSYVIIGVAEAGWQYMIFNDKTKKYDETSILSVRIL